MRGARQYLCWESDRGAEVGEVALFSRLFRVSRRWGHHGQAKRLLLHQSLCEMDALHLQLHILGKKLKKSRSLLGCGRGTVSLTYVIVLLQGEAEPFCLLIYLFIMCTCAWEWWILTRNKGE